MANTLQNFSIPSYSTILQSLLNDYRAISTTYGYNFSIDPGSELYIRYSALAGQLSVLYNAANILVNSKLIDSATGTNLDRVANAFGLYRRGATASQGAVQLVSAVSQTLIAGQTLTGSQGLQYQVANSGVYAPNSNVQVTSVDLGSNTNLAVGSLLTWSSPQVGLQSVTQVSVVITGGTDSEDDNTLRNRLYLQLQSPGQAYNGQGLITLAGSVDNLVQQSFVYSNFNGAGTQLIALVGYQTTSYIGRDIPHLLTDGYTTTYGLTSLQPGLVAQPVTNGPYNLLSLGVDNEGNQYIAGPGTASIGNPGSNLANDTGAIYGQLPGVIANPYATVITTVNNVASDISLSITLPYPIGNSINGYGNGWQDNVPWPVPDGYYVTDGYCKITAIQGNGTTITNGYGGVSATGFGITIHAPSSGTYNTTNPNVSAQTYNNYTPTPGNTHINWINRSDNQGQGWQIVAANVLAATDNGNQTWNVVLDTPLVFADGYDFYNEPGPAVGQFIFPASINAQNYLNTVMQQYALLGPGQTTTSSGLLLLGASRYPGTNTQFPNIIGVQLQKVLETTYNEVYAVPGYAYNTATTPAGQTVIGPAVNNPPNIFVPHHIAWYGSEQINFGI